MRERVGKQQNRIQKQLCDTLCTQSVQGMRSDGQKPCCADCRTVQRQTAEQADFAITPKRRSSKMQHNTKELATRACTRKHCRWLEKGCLKSARSGTSKRSPCRVQGKLPCPWRRCRLDASPPTREGSDNEKRKLPTAPCPPHGSRELSVAVQAAMGSRGNAMPQSLSPKCRCRPGISAIQLAPATLAHASSPCLHMRLHNIRMRRRGPRA